MTPRRALEACIALHCLRCASADIHTRTMEAAEEQQTPPGIALAGYVCRACGARWVHAASSASQAARAVNGVRIAYVDRRDTDHKPPGLGQ